MLVSCALVMLMTPGLALFYGGLTRSKNVLGTIMQSFMMLGVMTIQFVLIGYTLAFGPDQGGIIGNLDFIFLKDVSPSEPGPFAPTIPAQTFMVFQLMFAVITPALITGAFAERAKFSTFLVFMVIWGTVIYDPVAHWVWGGGFLGAAGLKALDFAGGTVVHINAGVAALVAAVMYGKRIGYGREPMEPHDITMVVIGAALLWFGWFGFNAGSALSTLGGATEEGGFILTASNAFVVTHLAAGTAAVVWVALSWMVGSKPSVIGAAAGAVAGLVAITPAAGFVSPMSALAIGAGAGAICYFAVRLRAKVGLDDSLDVVGVHGVGGAWGAVATGIFAGAAWGGVDGLIYGNGEQVLRQLGAVGVTILYSGIGTFIILKVLDLTMGLRVKEEDELVGIDVSEHGERAYQLEPGYAGIPVMPEPVASSYTPSSSTNPASAQG